jgi:hypothetical protein
MEERNKNIREEKEGYYITENRTLRVDNLSKENIFLILKESKIVTMIDLESKLFI